jgi:nucleoside-diphosphate-sugar epimerase
MSSTLAILAPTRTRRRAMSKRLALILGATGGIGGATARRLLDGGWRVRALLRGDVARLDPRCEPVRGDARDAAAVAAAAVGASTIVHAVNPPGYRDWAGQVLPMLDSTIAAARATGARVVLPGTVYNTAPTPCRWSQRTRRSGRSRARARSASRSSDALRRWRRAALPAC